MRSPGIPRAAVLPALVAALVAALVGCAQTTTEQAGLDDAELTLRLLATAIETADTAAVLDLFWPEATYDDFANQQSYQGIQEIVGYVMGAHAWGDDIYFNVGRVHATATGAVGEWVFSAVQARPVSDRIPEATGREVVLNGITVLELEGDRIMRAADYTDTGAMLLQLGAKIELPGGEVIEWDGNGG